MSATFIELRDTSRTWALSEATVGDNQKVIRVPIARLGEWKHPTYGEVKFTQTDFNQVIQNWEEGRAGYDPPLFLGHPNPAAAATTEGDPSEGWPERIFQEEDVLYGDYLPTSEALLSDVEQERYRYASAEIIRNARDKATGEYLGTLLVGTALTNRPFIPLKDHTVQVVERFSDTLPTEPPTLFVFDLQPNNLPMETPQVQSIGSHTHPLTPSGDVSHTHTADTHTRQQELQQFSAPAPAPTSAEPVVSKADYDKLAEQLSKTVEQFSSLAADYSQLKQQFSDMQKQRAEEVLNDKLAKLQALNIPAETKETFSDLLKSNSLSPADEERLFTSYISLSDSLAKNYTQIAGVPEVKPAEEKVPMPQVFSDTLARNQKIIEARAAAEAALYAQVS